MSLSTDLKYIKYPNYDLIDWLKTIQDPIRKRDIYLDVGITLKCQGFPTKKISRAYLQLADEPIVRVERLTDGEVVKFTCLQSKTSTYVSGDEDEYEVVSNSDSSEGDNQIEDLQQNNVAMDDFIVENKDFSKKKYSVEARIAVEELKGNNREKDEYDYDVLSCDSSTTANADGNYDSSTPLKSLSNVNINSSYSVKSLQDINSVNSSTLEAPADVNGDRLTTHNALLKDNCNSLLSDDKDKTKSGINQPQFEQTDEERNSSHQKPETSPQNMSKVSNVAERSPVINVLHRGQIDISSKNNFQNVKTGNSLTIKEKLNLHNVSEQTSVIEKSKCESVPSLIVDKNLLATSKNSDDDSNENQNSKNYKNIENYSIVDKFSLKKQPPKELHDGSYCGTQSEMKSCKGNSAKATSFGKFEDSIELNNKSMMLNISEGTNKSSVSLLPSTTVKDLIVMHNLKKQIEKKLKNCYSAMSSKNTSSMLSGEESSNSTLQTNTVKSKESCQKFPVSVGVNLFEHNLGKSPNHQKVNAMKINKLQLEHNNNLSEITNKPTEEPKFLEHDENKNNCEKGKSEPYASSKTSTNLEESIEGLKQINAQLHTIKKIAESRKRLSQNSVDEMDIIKKKRFCEKKTASSSQKSQGEEKDLKSYCGTVTQNKLETESSKNINKRQILQEPTLQMTMNSRQLPLQNHSGRSEINKLVNAKLSQTKEGAKSCSSISSTHNQSTTDELIQQSTISETTKLANGNSYKIQHLEVTDVNSALNPELKDLSQNIQEETIKTSLFAGHKTAIKRSIDESIGNLKRRQSVSVLENKVLTTQCNAESVINPLPQSSVLSSVSPHNSVLVETGSGIIANKDRNALSQVETSKQGSEVPISGLCASQTKTMITTSTQISTSLNPPTAINHIDSIDKSTNILKRRQSAQYWEKSSLLKNLLSEHSHTKSVNNKKNAPKESAPLPVNSQNALHIVAASNVSLNKNRPEFPQDDISSVPLRLPCISQAQITTTESTHATPLNPLPMGTLEINQLVGKAIQKFLTYFCPNLGGNINFIPLRVCESSNQYCFLMKRQPFSKPSEHLKLYMICYIKMFNNDELRKKINRIAELFHLAIADFLRRNERREQAFKLQSDALRKEEMSRADNDYNDILILRGRQFDEMFSFVLSTVNLVKGYEVPILVTFYFKITQALIKIDRENERYVFTLRELMESFLRNANSSLLVNCLSFFKIDLEEFTKICCFVKQCLFSLYTSGYFEVEKEVFWEIIHREPVIPRLDIIMAELNARNQAEASSGATNTMVSGQIPITLERLRNNLPQQFAPEIQEHVNQHTSIEISNSTKGVNQSREQTTFMQQRTQANQSQISQRQNLMVGKKIPTQNSTLASVEESLTLQQMIQSNQPTSSRSQANQSFYEHTNQRIPVLMRDSPSVAPNPQLRRQNAGTNFTYVRPPPPYPRTASQSNQPWQPIRSANYATPLNIRIPLTNSQNLENENIRSDSNPLMTQVCSMVGCSNSATLVCSLCRETVYCSTTCQTLDWYKSHSKYCLK